MLKAKKIAGVEVLLSASPMFRVSILEKKNKKLHLVETYEAEDVPALKVKLDKNIPLYLSIDGKGVLHKDGVYNENETLAKIFSKAFLSADASAFYIQPVGGNFVSAVRKDAVDGLFQELSSGGHYILGISLGPFVLNRIRTLLENKTITTSSYIVQLGAERIESFSRKENASAVKINIGGEQVNENFVLSFAAGLTYFISDDAFFESQILTQSKEEFKQKKKFSVLGTFILSFFLVLMLGNYLLYDHYKQSNAELQAQFDLQSANFQKSQLLKQELEEKKSLKEKLGVSGAARISYYADRVAASVPNQIQLTELSVNSVKKKIKDDKEIEYEVNTITIAGKCRKSIYYNDWKKELARMDWVKNISVENYVDADDEVGEFILKISF